MGTLGFCKLVVVWKFGRSDGKFCGAKDANKKPLPGIDARYRGRFWASSVTMQSADEEVQTGFSIVS